MSKLPLDGITVVSLEQAVAGPYATRQLADLGARVIKIERPGVGDFARSYDETVLGQASYFVWLNRSKESLAIDLKDERSQKILRDLLSTADVFIENLGPGATERLGFGADHLHEQFPRLIVCEITGYGKDGPWSDRKAYDLLVQCETGLVSITGQGDVLARAGVSVADIAAGVNAYAGILAALFRRATTGETSIVDISLFESLTEWMGAPDYVTMYTGKQPSRNGVEHATIAPYGRFYAKDETSIVLAVQNEREWLSLCTNLLGDPAIASDARFSSNSSRVVNRAALHTIIDSKIRQLDADEAESLLRRSGVPVARINSVQDALDHVVLRDRNRWREVSTPGGSIKALIPPVTLSGLEARMDAVPAVGEHTRSILGELGYLDAAIDRLSDEGVISMSETNVG